MEGENGGKRETRTRRKCFRKQSDDGQGFEIIHEERNSYNAIIFIHG